MNTRILADIIDTSTKHSPNGFAAFLVIATIAIAVIAAFTKAWSVVIQSGDPSGGGWAFLAGTFGVFTYWFTVQWAFDGRDLLGALLMGLLAVVAAGATVVGIHHDEEALWKAAILVAFGVLVFTAIGLLYHLHHVSISHNIGVY